MRFIKSFVGRGAMKKILSGILVLLLAVTMFADSKDVVSGVIDVAGGDKFPAGYFGQAAGYLPGDSIFVTNPETGVTLQFLNLGTLDSADGVVILLSNESAKTLGVKKGAGVRCKLNVRYGSFDETVVGQAVLDTEAPAVADSRSFEEEKKAPYENMGADVPAPSVPDVAAVAAPAVAGVPLFGDGEDDKQPEDFPAEEVAETAEVEVPSDEASVEDAIEEPAVEEIPAAEEAPAVEEVAAVAAEPVEAEPVVEEEPLVEEPVEAEPVEDYENEDATFDETKVAVEQPSPEEISEIEDLAEEPVAVEALPAAVEEEVPAVVEEVAETVEVEEVEAEPIEVEALADPVEEVAEETEEEVVEPAEEAVAEDKIEVEELSPVEAEAEVSDVPEVVSEGEFAPIVLVPAEKVVPESSDENVDVSESIEAVEPEEVVVVPEVAETRVVEVEPVAPVAASNAGSWKDLIVDSESDLKKGCWYVQIASLGNAENIEKTCKKYSKYPIALIPNGKGAYRILIGPLGVDEYGAVLAKFKSYGYKDAFLKKR